MRYGFSLVELSIVLVILGLLTGGILSGQSLIRAAELRSVSVDVGRYHTAALSFRDRYFALPGDMRNATDFWGAQEPVQADCKVAASSTMATCNGDGNGLIFYPGSLAHTHHEAYRAWQHLANAGLVEGTYTGIHGTPGPQYTEPGVNAPISKIRNATFNFYSPVATGKNLLMFGRLSDGNDPVISAEEAWGIDMKMDDGKPQTGKVTGPTFATRPNCVTADDADYAVTNTVANGCNMYFIGGY